MALAETPLDIAGRTAAQTTREDFRARWKRRLSLATLAALVFTIGFVVVTPVQAKTTMAKAIATMHAMGLGEPGNLGMLAIGICGVLLGRQGGRFFSRRQQQD